MNTFIFPERNNHIPYPTILEWKFCTIQLLELRNYSIGNQVKIICANYTMQQLETWCDFTAQSRLTEIDGR